MASFHHTSLFFKMMQLIFKWHLFTTHPFSKWCNCMISKWHLLTHTPLFFNMMQVLFKWPLFTTHPFSQMMQLISKWHLLTHTPLFFNIMQVLFKWPLFTTHPFSKMMQLILKWHFFTASTRLQPVIADACCRADSSGTALHSRDNLSFHRCRLNHNNYPQPTAQGPGVSKGHMKIHNSKKCMLKIRIWN